MQYESLDCPRGVRLTADEQRAAQHAARSTLHDRGVSHAQAAQAIHDEADGNMPNAYAWSAYRAAEDAAIAAATDRWLRVPEGLHLRIVP